MQAITRLLQGDLAMHPAIHTPAEIIPAVFHMQLAPFDLALPTSQHSITTTIQPPSHELFPLVTARTGQDRRM